MQADAWDVSECPGHPLLYTHDHDHDEDDDLHDRVNDENSILDCKFNPWRQHDCRPSEWAGVTCKKGKLYLKK